MHLKKIRALFSQLGTEESGIITFGQCRGRRVLELSYMR